MTCPVASRRASSVERIVLLAALCSAAACGGKAQDTRQDDDVVEERTGGTGHRGDARGSGGQSMGEGGTGGGAATATSKVFEPDLDEPCTEDFEAEEWVTGTLSQIYLGATVQVSRGLVLVHGLKDEGFDLVIGSGGGAEIWFGDPLEFPPGSELVTSGVSPSGTGALVIYDDPDGRWYRWFTIDLERYGWSGPIAMPAPLNEGEIALHFLQSGGVVLSSRFDASLRVHQFEGGVLSGEDTAEFFGRAMPGVGDALVSYRSPSLITEPHQRIEFVWDEGFGEPEDLPEFVVRSSTWTEWHHEFPSGVGVRAVSITSETDTEGLYLHTRRDGVWDQGLKLMGSPQESYRDAFGYAGEELLFVSDDGPALTARTGTGSGWGEASPLPRSRSTQFVGTAGDVNGTALVVGVQELPEEGVDALKLYRRGADGTWYCPVLAPPQLNQTVHTDDAGTFAVTTGGYQLPLTVWMLLGG